MGLRFARGTREYLATLAPAPKRALKDGLLALDADPRPAGHDFRLLRKEGRYLYFRLRVGEYRVIYSPVAGATYIWRVFHRNEGYAWLDTFDPSGQT